MSQPRSEAVRVAVVSGLFVVAAAVVTGLFTLAPMWLGRSVQPSAQPPVVAVAAAADTRRVTVDLRDPAPADICGGVMLAAAPVWDPSRHAYVAATLTLADGSRVAMPPAETVPLTNGCAVVAAVPRQFGSNAWGVRLTILEETP